MPDAPAIAVHDLRKVYGDKAAVDGLNLIVPRGCFFGFLGPNGAGKSTTIRMLTGPDPAHLRLHRAAGHAACRSGNSRSSSASDWCPTNRCSSTA